MLVVMSQNIYNCNAGRGLPWLNTKILEESLISGQINLPTAISQLGGVLRETLKVIEDYSSNLNKSHLERKVKLDKMEDIVNNLSAKCQQMQQALLYKEEKYEEKCREVARYEEILQLTTKRAMEEIDVANEDYDDKDDSPEDLFDREMGLDIKKAPYYAGGPCKRQRPQEHADGNLYKKIAAIGGSANPHGLKAHVGPVPLKKLYRPSNPSNDEQNERFRVASLGQSNEVMSSSRNGLDQTKHKFTGKNLSRHVPAGVLSRICVSRRKKEWPF